MAKYATGRRSLAISDRSGQAFPYTEMVREWNGSLVHISEFESKHPQIQRRYNIDDANGNTSSVKNNEKPGVSEGRESGSEIEAR